MVTSHNAGGYDVFGTAINAAGSAYLYSTYVGGSLDDALDDVASLKSLLLVIIVLLVPERL
jgi:hypothetical protein